MSKQSKTFGIAYTAILTENIALVKDTEDAVTGFVHTYNIEPTNRPVFKKLDKIDVKAVYHTSDGLISHFEVNHNGVLYLCYNTELFLLNTDPNLEMYLELEQLRKQLKELEQDVENMKEIIKYIPMYELVD